MLVKWKITYHIDDVVNVTYPLGDYSKCGIELHYKGKKLVRVEHIIEAGDTSFDEGLFMQSARDKHLQLLWEWMEYQRSTPIRQIRLTAERVSSGSTVRTGQISHTSQYCKNIEVNLPTESQIFNADPKLRIWLQCANQALHAIDDAEAIRNYYLILEGMKGKTDFSPKEKELNYTRDFVSHAKIDINEKALQFLQTELDITEKLDKLQYDRNDDSHQKLVKRQRKAAKSMIESELKKHL